MAKKVTVGFCSNCSTTIFGRPELWGGHTSVSASTLTHSEYFKPKKHVWISHMPKWESINTNLPAYKRNPR